MDYYYYSSVDTGLGAGYYIGISIVGILWIISFWRLFSKAGEKGWKAIIPIYNMYIMYKLFWKKMIFVVMLILYVAAFIGVCMMMYGMTVSLYSYAYYGGTEGAGVMMAGILILAASGIASFVLQIIFYSKLSASFGHGAGFTVGLVFLSVIFLMILAFGSSQYIGNRRQELPEDNDMYGYRE